MSTIFINFEKPIILNNRLLISLFQSQTANTAEEMEEDYEYDYELEPVSVVQGDIITDGDDDMTGEIKSVSTTDPDR